MATKSKNTQSSARGLTADEDRWRARSDADTLAQAQEIMGDKKRLTAAQASAREQAQRLDSVLKVGASPRAAAKPEAKPAAKPAAKVAAKTSPKARK